MPAGRKGWKPYKKPVVNYEPHRRIENPSQAQLDIIDFINNETDNLFVEAKAGSSKTSSSVESMYRLNNKSLSIVYLVFNNKNSLEAEGKVPPGVVVKTCHKLAWHSYSKAFNLNHYAIDSKGEKAESIACAIVGAEDSKQELRYNLIQALGLAKSYLVDTEQDILKIITEHEIGTDFTPKPKDSAENNEEQSSNEQSAEEEAANIFLSGITEEKFCQFVVRALEMSLEDYRRVDFNDMIWLAIKKNVRIEQYDLVYVDEAQDQNAARIELIMRSIKPGGRIVAVGDRFQSIYRFCGADSDAISRIIERTNAKVLPLNTTYRCGKSIVELAKTLVPEYEAAPSNPEGKVINCTEEFMRKNVRAGDFVLSRSNAPLVPTALQFLKEGRKCNIQGRDLGKSLGFMIWHSKAKDVNEFIDWLTKWRDVEVERLNKKNRDVSHIIDKYEVLMGFCEGAFTIKNVKDNIAKMFDENADDTDKIILSSVHRSKGFERDRVFVLMDTMKIDKGQEEKNIAYIAWTRARSELYLVSKTITEDTVDVIDV